MDQEAIAKIFALLDREIWVVTGQAGDRRGGLIATFVSQASIVPHLPRVLIGLAKQHHTWELVRSGGIFGLNLLGENHLELVWRFGLQSGHVVDKLANLNLEQGTTGCPLLADALAWLDCRVEASLDTGDRTLFLGRVLEGRMNNTGAPLTMKRLLQQAPPERFAELKQQLTRDAAWDAEAILAWQGNSSIWG